MKQQADWGPIWAVQRVVFQQYYKLDGRATRAEYWWFLGAYLIRRPNAGRCRGPFGPGLSIRSAEPVALVGSCTCWRPGVSRRYLRCGSVGALDLGSVRDGRGPNVCRAVFDVATGANRLGGMGG